MLEYDNDKVRGKVSETINYTPVECCDKVDTMSTNIKHFHFFHVAEYCRDRRRGHKEEVSKGLEGNKQNMLLNTDNVL